MTYNLRDYQHQFHDAVFKEWESHTSTLAVAATGTGKTVCFAAIIRSSQPKRAMVLAHRNELIIQARDKIEAMTGLGVEIEKAELYASTNLFQRTPVVVSSIQTQISGPKDNKRYTRFNPFDFGVLICDEAHHALSKSWREVIAHYRKNPELRVLGVTATPDRADKEAMGQMFETVAFNYGILDAIQNGWLVDLTQQFVRVKGLDFSEIRTTCGDLNEGDLCKVMEAEENVQGICQPTLEAIYGLEPKTLSSIPVVDWKSFLESTGKNPRRTIVFTVSVAQAESCCNVFSRAMPGVEWVCGSTKKEKRRMILERFANGETHVVANCGVLTEGFDEPAVELISMARPTKSRSLYAQIVGRSLRPLPGIVDGLTTLEERREAIKNSSKPFARIIDFVGNSGRHKLVSCVDILGGKVSDEAAERAKKKAMEDGKPKKILISMVNSEKEIEAEKERERLRQEERERQNEEARKQSLLAKVSWSSSERDPFNGQMEKISEPAYSKDGRKFSDKQAMVLRRAGYDPNRFGYRQGQAIIGKLLEKPSDKQIAVIARYGRDATHWTRKEASSFLDALAQNHWKLPVESTEVPASGS